MTFTSENEFIYYFLCLLLESTKHSDVSSAGVHIPAMYATVQLRYRISSVASIILTAKAKEVIFLTVYQEASVFGPHKSLGPPFPTDANFNETL